MMSLFEQTIEILHGSEDWIDVTIISDVISKVGHRRPIHWRHPNSVNPEVHQIVESLDNTIQVSYAVSVAVLKRARINLVYHCGLPPIGIVHLTCSKKNLDLEEWPHDQ